MYVDVCTLVCVRWETVYFSAVSAVFDCMALPWHIYSGVICTPANIRQLSYLSALSALSLSIAFVVEPQI